MNKIFTGQQLDQTGLYYYGARYYDANIGRFISPDTVVPNWTNPQSVNRYSYCLNNPLRYVDPSGHGEHSWDEVPDEVWAYMQSLSFEGSWLDIVALATTTTLGIMGWMPREYQKQLLCNDTLHDTVVGYYEQAVKTNAPIPFKYVTGTVHSLTFFGWKWTVMDIVDRFGGEAMIISDDFVLELISGKTGEVWFPGALSVNDLKGGMEGFSLSFSLNAGPYFGFEPIVEHGAHGAEWGPGGGPFPITPSVRLASNASVYIKCCPASGKVCGQGWDWRGIGKFFKRGLRWVGFDPLSVDECKKWLDCEECAQ